MDNKEAIGGALLQALTVVSDVVKQIFNPENIKQWTSDLQTIVSIVGFFANHLDGIVTTLEVIGTVLVGIKTVNALGSIAAVLPVISAGIASLSAGSTVVAALGGGFAALLVPIAAVAAALGAVLWAYKAISAEVKDYKQDNVDLFHTGNENAVSDPSRITAASPQWKIDKANAARSANGELPLGYTPSYATGPSLNTASAPQSMSIAPVINIDMSGTNMSEEDANHTGQQIAAQINTSMTQLLNQSVSQSGN